MGKVANVGFRTTDGQVCSVHFFKPASMLILLAIVVTNVSFNFSSRFGNLEFIYLTILP